VIWFRNGASLAAVVLAALPGFPFESPPPTTREAHLDAEGVLRWQDNGAEIALLGVNYYAPRSYIYEIQSVTLSRQEVGQ
jgi:hypothetical protein